MRIIALSDAHGQYKDIVIPNGDVLICAGDMPYVGTRVELYDFNLWLGTLPHKHKIVVAGNHDWCFQNHRETSMGILSNAIYLEDSGYYIEGVLFWGSPWTLEFFEWAFMLPDEQALKEKFDLIPKETNVLISHSPPYGILDRTQSGEHVGSNTLTQAMTHPSRTLPNIRVHVFGHIHEAHGELPPFFNVSICNEIYEPVNLVTIIEI